MSLSTLEILPVEIFHLVLDNLDRSSVFHLFSGICERLNGMINSSNRYKI